MYNMSSQPLHLADRELTVKLDILETLYSALVLSLLLQTDRFLVDFCTTKRMSVAWQKLDNIGLKTFPAGLASVYDHPRKVVISPTRTINVCSISQIYSDK